MAEVTQEPERKIKIIPEDVRVSFDPIAAREKRKQAVEKATHSSAPKSPPVVDILDKNIGGVVTGYFPNETKRR